MAPWIVVGAGAAGAGLRGAECAVVGGPAVPDARLLPVLHVHGALPASRDVGDLLLDPVLPDSGCHRRYDADCRIHARLIEHDDDA